MRPFPRPYASLDGRVALVTGAATGIGRATALAFGRAGMRVAVGHLRQDALASELVAAIRTDGGTAIAVEADVTSSRDVERMVRRVETDLGPLDVSVHSAGVIQERPFLETTDEDWDFVVGVDLKGIFVCCRAVLAGMAARGRGSVINIASELGHLGRAQYAPYCAAKSGVMGLTRSLAREFAPAVRVNAIAPGPVDTPMLSLDNMSPEVFESERAIPAGRVGRPEEIAATALFLASDEASFFYGQVLGANGGASM